MFLNRGDRLAMVDFEDRKINYTELVNNVKYFSENVITAEKNDFGLILMENRPEWIYTYFALWDRKAVPIALDSTSNSKEILYVLEDSEPKFIICSDETEKNVKEAVSIYDKGQVVIINVDSYSIDVIKEILSTLSSKQITNFSIILKLIDKSNTKSLYFIKNANSGKTINHRLIKLEILSGQ